MKSSNMRMQPTVRPTTRPQNAPWMTENPNVSMSEPEGDVTGQAVPYLLVRPLPEAAREEDDADGRLQVGTDGLDVDEELTTLAGLDDRNPQHRNHHQHEHKHPTII